MIQIFADILIIFLLLVIFFFLIRTLIISISLLTEVPYLPSNKSYKQAIEKLNIQPGDNVVDLGSGDGRVLIYASKKYPKAYFIGVERNRALVIFSKIKAAILNRKNLNFICADIHDFNLEKFNKIYMFLLPDFIDKIMSEHSLQKGCTVVSLYYPLGKSFTKLNNVTKYPVKYGHRKEFIYKWVNK